MQLTQVFLILSSLAVPNFASNHVERQTITSTACNAFTGISGVFDTLNSINLQARSAAGAVSALFLNSVQTVPMTTWMIISETGSGGWTYLNLQGGVLEPIATSEPQWQAVSIAVPDESSPTFVNEQFALSLNVPHQYCGVPDPTNASAPPLLALSGRTDLFTICTNYTNTGTHRNDLVYNLTGDLCTEDSGKCLLNCFPVQVEIIPYN